MVSEIKLLLTEFNQREVSMITGMATSTISRIANNRIKKHVETPVAAQLSEFARHAAIIRQLRRVDGITGFGSLTKRDKQYISILKKIGANLEDVKEHYADIPPGDVRSAWNYCGRENLSDFDYTLLRLENSDIQILKTMLSR